MNGIEKWLDVVGYDGVYKISNFGNVKSIDRKVTDSRGRSYMIPGKVKKIFPDTDGYMIFRVSKKSKGKLLKVHREVLKSFSPTEDSGSLVVNHLDGNKKNNYIENLEWTTIKGNVAHFRNKLDHGKFERSKYFSDEKLIIIADEFLAGGLCSAIGKRYNVSYHLIRNIVTLKYHKYALKRAGYEKRLLAEVEKRKENITDIWVRENLDVLTKYYKEGVNRQTASALMRASETKVRAGFKKVIELNPGLVKKRKLILNKKILDTNKGIKE